MKSVLNYQFIQFLLKIHGSTNIIKHKISIFKHIAVQEGKRKKENMNDSSPSFEVETSTDIGDEMEDNLDEASDDSYSVSSDVSSDDTEQKIKMELVDLEEYKEFAPKKEESEEDRKGFVCPICTVWFATDEDFMAHVRFHHLLEGHKTVAVQTRFQKEKKRRQLPNRRELTRELICPICKQDFSSEVNFLEHVDEHEISGKRLKSDLEVYECSKCSNTYRNQSSLDAHFLRKHATKNLKCPECSYITAVKHDLAKHRLKHSAEKPFKCTECSFETHFQRNLKGHMRKHTGERPYKCDKCSHATTTSSLLKKHKMTHNPEGKIFHCEHCTYSAYNQYSLKKHEILHFEEKRHKCNQCPKEFHYKAGLNRHIKNVHTGEKPFSCPDCEYSSTNSYNLKVHRRIHSGDKPFKCEYCQYASTQKHAVLQHQRNRHSEKEENETVSL